MGYIRGDEWDWKLSVNWVGPYTVVLDREDLATHLYVSNLWLKYEESNGSIYINLFQPSIVIGGGPLSFFLPFPLFFIHTEAEQTSSGWMLSGLLILGGTQKMNGLDC